jgi:predicted RNase H-like nuclease (RuvC/YqgF family)
MASSSPSGSDKILADPTQSSDHRAVDIKPDEPPNKQKISSADVPVPRSFILNLTGEINWLKKDIGFKEQEIEILRQENTEMQCDLEVLRQEMVEMQHEIEVLQQEKMKIHEKLQKITHYVCCLFDMVRFS